LFVQVIELVNIDFLKGVLGAELVDFVVDLVEYPGLVIVNRVILDGVINHFFFEPVHHFDLSEVNHDSS
jgi:hypothetical protein